MSDTIPRRDFRTGIGLVATGAFTAGCLLTQAVTVPAWRSAPPNEALAAFRRSGPATGAVLFPTEIVSTAVLTGLAVSARRRHDPSAGLWAGALKPWRRGTKPPRTVSTGVVGNRAPEPVGGVCAAPPA